MADIYVQITAGEDKPVWEDTKTMPDDRVEEFKGLLQLWWHHVNKNCKENDG